jgi:hypothetical protein
LSRAVRRAGPRGSWTEECWIGGEAAQRTSRCREGKPGSRRSARPTKPRDRGIPEVRDLTNSTKVRKCAKSRVVTKLQNTRWQRDGDLPGAHGRPTEQKQPLESKETKMRRSSGRNQAALRLPNPQKTPKMRRSSGQIPFRPADPSRSRFPFCEIPSILPRDGFLNDNVLIHMQHLKRFNISRGTCIS